MCSDSLLPPALVLAVLPALAMATPAPDDSGVREDMQLDTVGLLSKYGYGGEAHDVTTEDGYVLQLHRAPRSPRRSRSAHPADAGSPMPVFLQHGLLSTSADWVVLGPEQSLAYQLADAGYDVWMGNARGNSYSRRHLTLKSSDPEFWKFSFHEVGVYDLAASIDYVLQRTGHKKLIYVGHSMGTTSFFVLCSEKPEYNDKVRAMFAFAPVAYFTNMKSLVLRTIAQAHKPIAGLLRSVGLHELLLSAKVKSLVARSFCTKESTFRDACKRLAFWVMRYDENLLSEAKLPVILSHMPDAVSTRCLQHFGQLIASDEFRQYDHGIQKNKEIYGQPEPPSYNVRNITVPVYLHWGRNDPLTNIKDVEKLEEELSNCKGMYEVPDKQFHHLDFIFANDVKRILYDGVLKQIRNYYLDYRVEFLLSKYNTDSLPP